MLDVTCLFEPKKNASNAFKHGELQPNVNCNTRNEKAWTQLTANSGNGERSTACSHAKVSDRSSDASCQIKRSLLMYIYIYIYIIYIYIGLYTHINLHDFSTLITLSSFHVGKKLSLFLQSRLMYLLVITYQHPMKNVYTKKTKIGSCQYKSSHVICCLTEAINFKDFFYQKQWMDFQLVKFQ